MPRMRKKGDLPAKRCAHCDRAFAWRRKWARDWPRVKYCSKACRSAHSGPAVSSGVAG
ncbi:DUF2256 domain-containing protein [Salinisphaera sp. RV14]|uniref:DUF2256 domain-containing protein n=1 Tax=unclassified Salinisphaera TaxID=2649847 RepID=UPI003F8369F3